VQNNYQKQQKSHKTVHALNELVLVKEKLYESKQQFEKFRDMAEIRSKMNHEYISTVIYSKFQIEKEWCSTFYKGM